MADITTNTLKIEGNNLILRDADAQAKLTTHTQKIAALEEDATSLKEDYTTILDSAYATDTASGAIASFPDGADGVPVKSLTVDIEPEQDLHGQANPWPAGGGKNLCPQTAEIGIAWNGSPNSSRARITIPCEPSTQYTLSVNGTNNIELIVYGYSPTLPATNIDTASVPQTFTTLSDSHYITLGFNKTNIAQSDIDALKLQLEKGSTASAYVPYSNICPISGWTSAVVTRTGVNLFDKTTITDGYALVSSTGELEANINCFVTDYISVKEGVTYFIPNRGTSRACVYSADKIYVQRVSEDSGAMAWTAPIDGYIRLTSNKTITTADDFQINIGSTATAYEPYSGQTVTIDLGGTRYGGTLDVTTGVLTVDRAMVDLGSLTWDRLTTSVTDKYRFGSNTISNVIEQPSSYMVTGKLYCSILKEIRGNQPINNVNGIGIHTNGNVIVYYETYSGYTVEQFTAAVNGQTLVYPLATPQSVQLTAQEVKTLLGQNNIFADTGDTEVEYRADTKLYIEKLTAPTEDDMIADHAISSGSFFMVGNTLYRATTAIASGATITVGTNATKLSLSDALNALA